MTEKEKMIAGLQYNAYDKELSVERLKSKTLCFEYNRIFKYDYPGSGDPNFNKEATDILENHINFVASEKSTSKLASSKFFIEPPFYCDFGYRITAGENFYANHNCMIWDAGGVTFGDNVMIAGNVQISTLNHFFDPILRREGFESAKPIVIGNDVWIGGNVVILGGVTIGDNCIIGAGAVVTRSIPANSVAMGVPARVTKTIEA